MFRYAADALKSAWRIVTPLGVAVAIGTVALIVVVVLALDSDGNRQWHANVERVRLECGNTMAHKFEVIYKDATGATAKSREWAEQCALGKR